MAHLSDTQIAGVAKNAGFAGSDIAIAVAVALAESGGNTLATNHNRNGSYDYGLFQINTVHKDLLSKNNWRDPNANARMAFKIKNDSHSWHPWTTYNSGSYLKFLSRGKKAAGNPVGTPEFTPDNPNDPNAVPVAGGGSLFGNWLVDRSIWVRVFYFITGAILITLALLRMTGMDKEIIAAGKDAAKTAIKVAVLVPK